MKEKSFDELLQEAHHILQWVEDSWHTWWFYCGQDTPLRIQETFDQYPAVAKVATYTSYVAVIVGIYKLYDRPSKALSIPFLCREGKRQGIISESTLRRIRPLYKQASILAEKLRIVRNQRIAHCDSLSHLAVVFQEANITYDEVARAISLSCDIFENLGSDRGTAWIPNYCQVLRELTTMWEGLASSGRAQESPSPSLNRTSPLSGAAG